LRARLPGKFNRSAGTRTSAVASTIQSGPPRPTALSRSKALVNAVPVVPAPPGRHGPSAIGRCARGWRHASIPSGTAGAGSSARSITISAKWSAGTPQSSTIAGPPSSPFARGFAMPSGGSAKRWRGARRSGATGGPQYIADAWINEVKWLGCTISPSYVGEPECNGVAERFMRTLKEQCIYLHSSRASRRHDASSASSSRGTTPSGLSNASAIGPRRRRGPRPWLGWRDHGGGGPAEDRGP
jgi:hypothetical protein